MLWNWFLRVVCSKNLRIDYDVDFKKLCTAVILENCYFIDFEQCWFDSIRLSNRIESEKKIDKSNRIESILIRFDLSMYWIESNRINSIFLDESNRIESKIFEKIHVKKYNFWVSKRNFQDVKSFFILFLFLVCNGSATGTYLEVLR